MYTVYTHFSASSILNMVIAGNGSGNGNGNSCRENGNGNDSTEIGGNGNNKTHSRTSPLKVGTYDGRPCLR